MDVEISVRQWADANANMVNFYLHYFVYTGANRGKADSRRHSVVRIEVPDRDAIIPDAVFRLQYYGTTRGMSGCSPSKCSTSTAPSAWRRRWRNTATR